MLQSWSEPLAFLPEILPVADAGSPGGPKVRENFPFLIVIGAKVLWTLKM